MITEAFVQRYLERLLRRYPHLAALSVRVVPLSEAPLDTIADLLNNAWLREYGDRPRIAFSPAFLQMHMGSGTGAANGGIAVLAEWTGQLCGVSLGLPFSIRIGDTPHNTIIGTGLAVTKEVEGLGVAEILMAHQVLALLRTGCPMAFKWRRVNEEQPGDHAATRTRELLVTLYAKPLDSGKCIRRARMGFWNGLGVRVLRMVYGGRRPIPSPYSVAPFVAENDEICATFMNTAFSKTHLQRIFSAEEIRRRWTFADQGIVGCGWLLYRDGVLCGVAGGYVNPDTDGTAWFSLDCVVMERGVTISVRRAFLSQVEEDVREQYACFAVMTPATVCREPIDTWGYRAVKRYRLGYEALAQDISISQEQLQDLLIELR